MEHNKFKKQNLKPNNNYNYKSLNGLIIISIIIIGNVVKNVEAYKNYTVGDSLGWFDKLEKPSIDFDNWASTKSFSLGDFLIFNTDSNHSVIQTSNIKTYTSCDTQSSDTVQWSNIDPNSTDVQPVTVPVPLTKEGPTYFFSGDYDGEQCLNGQKFAIKVTHGQGLPPALKDDSSPGPANSAPGPANADSGGDDQSAPDTIVPADFNHPKNLPGDENNTDDNDTKKSNDANYMSNNKGFLFSLISGVFIFIFIC